MILSGNLVFPHGATTRFQHTCSILPLHLSRWFICELLSLDLKWRLGCEVTMPGAEWWPSLFWHPSVPFLNISALSHSPRVWEREPPFRKATPPLGEKPFSEAFCYLRVLTQKMLNLLRQQGLSRLGEAEMKRKTEFTITNFIQLDLTFKWVASPQENWASCLPWSP
jgi:hypothetical protein